MSDAEIDQLASLWLPGTAVTIVDHPARVSDYPRRSAAPVELRRMLSLAILRVLAVWLMMLFLPLLGWVPAFQPSPAIVTSRVPDSSNGVRFLMLLGSARAAGTFGAMRSNSRGSGHHQPQDDRRCRAWRRRGISHRSALHAAQIAISGQLELPLTPAHDSRVALIVSKAAVPASLYLDVAFSRFDLFKDSVMSGTYGKNPEDK